MQESCQKGNFIYFLLIQRVMRYVLYVDFKNPIEKQGAIKGEFSCFNLTAYYIRSYPALQDKGTLRNCNGVLSDIFYLFPFFLLYSYDLFLLYQFHNKNIA